MSFLNFNSVRPAVKLLIILLAMITIGVIVFFAGILFARVIFWMHLDEVNNVLYGRYELLTDWQLKYFQSVQSLGFFVLPGFFLYWLFSTPTTQYFEIKRYPNAKLIGLVLIAFIAGMPLINWIIELNQNINLPSFLSEFEFRIQDLESKYEGLTERLLITNNLGQYLFNILMIAALPAIGEELLFRGVFQKLFLEVSRNIHLSIIITAFIFSAVHGQFYGFIPRFLLGLFFGYLMVWSGNIWLSVIAHFINNAIAVTVYYIASSSPTFNESKVLGLEPTSLLVFTSLILFSITVYFIKRGSLNATKK